MKNLSILLVIVIIFGSGAYLVHKKKALLSAAPVPTARPIPVRTALSKTGSLSDTRSYLAQVKSWQTAKLSSRITGRLVEIIPREGDTVQKGQCLATLEDAELQSNLSEEMMKLSTLKRNASYWEKEYLRDKMLARDGAIAQATADNTADRLSDVQGRLRAQKKKCESLQVQLGYARIISPFDGVVSRRLADPGDMAMLGKTLLVVEDRSRLKICFDIPQPDISRVNMETPIRVNTDSKLHTLEISRIYPTLNPDHTMSVEAYAPASLGLRSGSYCRIKVVLNHLDNVVLVPEACLITAPDGRQSIITIEQNVTVIHSVTVILRREGWAAVKGISPGMRLVRSTYLGWNRLSNGERVEVIQ